MRTTKRTTYRATYRTYRKVLQLLVSAGLVLGLSGQAQAATFDPSISNLDFALAGLPQSTFLALPGTESLVVTGNQPQLAGHRLWMSSTIWSTINFGPGTSLFTGVPSISNLKVTVQNDAGHVEDGFSSAPSTGVPTTHFGGGHVQGGGGGQFGPTFGGISKITGQVVLQIIGGLEVAIPLNLVGGPLGTATTATVGPIDIFATGHPFVTSTVQISQVTSNIITLPRRAACTLPCTPTVNTRVQGVAFTLNVDVAGGETSMTLSTGGGFVSLSFGNPLENNTVTVSGSNQLLSGSQAGRVTVVAPLWIDAGAALGNLPAAITLDFEFVPEPGTLLLLVSGAAGLALIGRRRMRK